jgi:glycosyltransferase involved in cell wall biosynthesis
MAIDAQRRVFVILSVFRPDRELLSRQIASLTAQSYRNFVVLVCADGPLQSDAAAIVSGCGDPRVVLRAYDAHAGVHENFARGLREALTQSDADTDLFAFCDQDDVWHPAKIERQAACFADGKTSLCHSDARVVSPGGKVLAQSLFDYESRPRAGTFTDLLIMNAVTGMTAMFRRDVAVGASAFPMSRCRHILHDHWTALVAALLGEIRLIDEPLVDYVQHAASVMGAQTPPSKSGRPSPAGGHAYWRKCYRQYLWHRRAFLLLQQQLGHIPEAAEKLSAVPVRMLFDCEISSRGALALSLAYRLRGRARQADQIWRLGRGKALYCSRQVRSVRDRALVRAGARMES